MTYYGDFIKNDIVDIKFTTVNTSGVPTQLAGSPAVAVYFDNNTTEITAGVTLTVDFDARAGLNHVRIDTSADAGYQAGRSYQVVITAGTVGGNSVVGYVVGSFSIEHRRGIVDLLLKRSVSNVETAAAEHSLATIVLAMLEHSISGSTLTIRRTDGTTTHFTKALTVTPGANPITGIQ